MAAGLGKKKNGPSQTWQGTEVFWSMGAMFTEKLYSQKAVVGGYFQELFRRREGMPQGLQSKQEYQSRALWTNGRLVQEGKDKKAFKCTEAE